MRERTPWQLLVSPNADRLPMRWSLLIQARLRTRSAPRPKADSLRSRASTPGGRRTARSTGIPHHPHPGRPELGLLYVGISPTRATSAGLIRSRVVDQHLGGNTASSTFRFVLAAFLFDKLSLTPRAKSKKGCFSLRQVEPDASSEEQEGHPRCRGQRASTPMASRTSRPDVVPARKAVGGGGWCDRLAAAAAPLRSERKPSVQSSSYRGAGRLPRGRPFGRRLLRLAATTAEESR